MYLQAFEKNFAKKSSGFRVRFSKALQCQPPYMSRVLSGRSDLSMEQAFLAAKYFKFNEEEVDYFLLLVQHARAGLDSLKRALKRKILERKKAHYSIEKNLKANEVVSDAIKRQYYSSWKYGAVLMFFTIPKNQTANQAIEYFGFAENECEKIIHFLVKAGLLSKKGSKYSPTEVNIFLEKTSTMTRVNHLNWRIHLLSKLQSAELSPEDFHFSANVTITRKDAEEFKLELNKLVKKFHSRVTNSQSEESFIFCSDFYSL